MGWESYNAYTGSKTTSSGGRPERSAVSSNPWSAALKAQYDAAKASSSTNKDNWNSAVAKAKDLSGKDYTAELRRFATEDINQEQTQQGNQLGAIGMRELSLQKDVADDWAKRRTDASSKAAITGQGMQLDALGALTSTIASASADDLNQIALALDAASAGAAADQNWTSMSNSTFESDRDFSRTLMQESEAKKQAAIDEIKAKNAAEFAAWQQRNAAYRARTATPARTNYYGPK